MHEGTEATTAQQRDEMFAHGLPTRVKHLETTVDALHKDSLLTQGALAGLSSQVAAMADSLKDFGSKLDDQRTKRPDWGTMATWAGVLLVVGAMAFSPVSKRVDRLENALDSDMAHIYSEIEKQKQVHVEDAFLMGQQQARLEALEKSETRTWAHCAK